MEQKVASRTRDSPFRITYQRMFPVTQSLRKTARTLNQDELTQIGILFNGRFLPAVSKIQLLFPSRLCRFPVYSVFPTLACASRARVYTSVCWAVGRAKLVTRLSLSRLRIDKADSVMKNSVFRLWPFGTFLGLLVGNSHE